MTAQKRGTLMFILFLCLAMIPMAAQADDDFGRLRVVDEDATTAEFSWEGPDDETYEIQLVVGEVVYTLETGWDETGVTVTDMPPETEYEIYITQESTGDRLTKTFETYEAKAFRTYSYRWNLCRIYVVNEANSDFWDNGRKRVQTESRSSMKSLQREGELNVIIEFSWNDTSSDKEIDTIVVMRTPDGSVYWESDSREIEGSWEGVYSAFSLEGLAEEFLDLNDGAWLRGVYNVELYFDELFAGRAEFEIE